MPFTTISTWKQKSKLNRGLLRGFSPAELAPQHKATFTGLYKRQDGGGNPAALIGKWVKVENKGYV